MPSFSVNAAREVPASELFADMPQSFRGFVRRGFEQISQLDDTGVRSLAKALADGYEPADESGLEEILKRLALEIKEKQSFGVALSLLTILITSRDDLLDVLAAGESSDVIPTAHKERIQQIALQLGREKGALADGIESAELASRVLPSFERLLVATELRFKFDESKIEKAVPVAVCHLSTDSKENQCFFQLKRSDVVHLISLFKKMEAQLAAIEAWSKGRV